MILSITSFVPSTEPGTVVLRCWKEMAAAYVLLGLAGNFTAMIMFLSPAPTLWRILHSRDTGSFSPVPYACTLLNCLLWLFYGLPAVTTGNALVVSINAVGVALECFYLLLFFAFAPAAHRGFLSMLLVGVVSLFATSVATAISAFPLAERARFVGSLCVVVGTLMYASPLAVIRLVISTRSVEYMPLPLSLCSTINALCWTSYGVLKQDMFLIIPNTLGTILGLLQLAIYAHYGGSRSQENVVVPEYAPIHQQRSTESKLKQSNS